MLTWSGDLVYLLFSFIFLLLNWNTGMHRILKHELSNIFTHHPSSIQSARSRDRRRDVSCERPKGFSEVENINNLIINFLMRGMQAFSTMETSPYRSLLWKFAPPVRSARKRIFLWHSHARVLQERNSWNFMGEIFFPNTCQITFWRDFSYKM